MGFPYLEERSHMAFCRTSWLGLVFVSTLSLAGAGCGGGIENGDYVLIRVAFADVKEDASCYADGEIPKEIRDDTTTFRGGSTFILYRGPEDAYYLDTQSNVMEGALEGDAFTFGGESVDVEYLGGLPAETIVDTDHDNIEDNQDNMVDADMDGLDDGFDDDVVDLDGDGDDDRFGDPEVDVNDDGVDDRLTVITPATDGDKYTTTNSLSVTFTIANEQVAGSTKASLKVTCKGVDCPSKLPDCTQNIDFVGTVVKDADVEHQL